VAEREKASLSFTIIVIQHIFTIYKLRKNEYEKEEEASMCLQEIEGQRYHERKHHYHLPLQAYRSVREARERKV
jgi:hypothetical protein